MAPVGQCQEGTRDRGSVGDLFIGRTIRLMLYQFIADKSLRVVMSRSRFIGVDHVISDRCPTDAPYSYYLPPTRPSPKLPIFFHLGLFLRARNVQVRFEKHYISQQFDNNNSSRVCVLSVIVRVRHLWSLAVLSAGVLSCVLESRFWRPARYSNEMWFIVSCGLIKLTKFWLIENVLDLSISSSLKIRHFSV